MGAYIDTDTASGKQTVTETFTCPHHNSIHPLYDENGRRLDVAVCRKCMRPVCDRCVMIEASGGNMCQPIARRFDHYERRVNQAIARAESREAMCRAILGS